MSDRLSTRLSLVFHFFVILSLIFPTSPGLTFSTDISHQENISQDVAVLQEPEPTAEPTETPSPETVEPPTPTEDMTATPSIEVSLTPIEATPTHTSTAIITATTNITVTQPTPTGTPTPTTPALPLLDSITLSLLSSTTFITPGKTFTLTWDIPEVEGKFITVDLVLVVPPDLTPLNQASHFMEEERLLKIPISEGSGAIAFAVEETVKKNLEFFAWIEKEDTKIAFQTLKVKPKWQAEIDPSGGEIGAFNEKVKIKFPKGVIENVLVVEVTTPSEDSVPYFLSSSPFEIQAFTKEDKSDVYEFKEPIAIEVNYDDEQVRGDESTLTLFYYNEQTKAWQPLPTQVFSDTNILVGFSDHFTAFDFNTQDWEAARLPDVSGFQVASFTGSGTYNYPIDVPPGPGGLQPSLSLNYNSQIVDSATSRTQASWVGMGWSLDTGYIQRDMHGTPTNTTDDTFSLFINGSGSLLLPITDQDGDSTTNDFRLQDENFWRIRQYTRSGNVGGYNGGDTSYWVVWDKNGNQYYFGYNQGGVGQDNTPVGHAWYPIYPSWFAAPTMTTWRWSLTEQRNIFGKELYYEYQYEGSVKYHPLGQGYNATALVAVYPYKIIYPNNRYQIRFERIGRADYESAWLDPHAYILFMRALLEKIYIEHDSNGDGVYETIIRKYQFTHNYGGVLPNVAWSAGGRTPSLTQIQEFGLGGSSPLPATTFTYDQMHLLQVDNGYGGRVTLSYEGMPWYENTSSDFQDYIGGEIGESGEVYHFLSSEDVQVYHPGRIYVITAQTSQGTPLLSVGLQDQDGWKTATQISKIPQDGWDYYTFILLMDSDASRARFFYKFDNAPWGVIRDYVVYPVVTRYRVVTRTVLDQVTGESSATTYQYDEPATNDSTHSVFAGASIPEVYRFTPVNSEFRGHAAVKENSPDGKVTFTFFNQDDKKRGVPVTTIVGKQEFFDPFNSFDTSPSGLWVLGTGAAPVVERSRGDNSVRLTSPDATWKTIARNGFALAHGDSLLVQFMLNGSSAANIAVDSGTWGSQIDPYRRWGISVKSDNSVTASYCISTSCMDSSTLLSTGQFQRDTWYMLLLMVDDDSSFMARVWKRDDPDSVRRTQLTMDPGRSWHFMAQSQNGNLWLDEYWEGQIYSLSDAIYDADSDTPLFDTSQLPYWDLTNYWNRTVREKTFKFEGGSTFISNQSEYDYSITYQGNVKQYGNLVHTYESYWNGSAYVRYRATRSVYFPADDSSKYLVGLLAYQNSFASPAGVCDFENQDLLSSFGYVYDSNSYSSTPPTVGKVSLYRKQVRWAGTYTDHRYLDIRYAYDNWGNITNTTVYQDEGGFGITHTLKPATTTTLYDSSYHTYPIMEINSLGQATFWTYNYAYGVPVSETTSNGATTTASYDSFARLTKIVRPYDSDSSPTIQVSYHIPTGSFDNNPFWTEVTQKIDTTGNLVVRKFYNGLGQLLQTQTANANLGASINDILVDYYYDSTGRLEKQSVPYATIPSAGFQARITSQPYTLSLYDTLGRTVSVTGTDGQVQSSTSYGIVLDPTDGKYYQKTCSQDGLSQETCSYRDAFGNTIKVDPPDGPSVVYTYDEQDRMKSAQLGTAPATTINYDLASRKTSMFDPDMGAWTYGYDPQGKLVTQTDARGCTTNLSYDLADRINMKNYIGTSCGSTAGTAYSYETPGRLDSFDGSSLPAGWTQTSGASVSGGSLHITGISTWDRYVRRSEAQNAGLSASFLFKVNSTTGWAQMYFDSGTRLTSDYRRLGVKVEGAGIYRQTYDGPPPSNNVYMMPVQANVWYQARMILDINGIFSVQVWEKDNPSVYAESTVQPANWGGRAWTFQDEVYSGVQDLDDYSETRGTGVDQTMTMSDGSGSTTWDYDLLGRVIREAKIINDTGGGTFTTQWTYNSASLMKTMTYPDGEIITYSYNNQALLNSLSNSSTTYVQSTDYDPAGRTQSRRLAGGTLVTDYNYYDWTTLNGVGRLQQIAAGVSTDPDSLQDLRYTYSTTGNILSISDYISGSPQTQTFSYDAVNRLISAQAVGGSIGIYSPETYSYDPNTGNLANKAGVSYTYNFQVVCPAGTRTLPHAVSAAGNNSYTYDCNGNMTQRLLNGTQFDQVYDAENRLVEVGSVNDYIFNDMFESGDLSAWSSNQTDGGDLSVTGAAAIHDGYGMQAVIDDAANIYTQDNSPNNEKEYRVRFYLNRNSLSMGKNKVFSIFEGYNDAGGNVFSLRIRKDSDNQYKLSIRTTLDSAVTQESAYVVINAVDTAIEVRWKASSSVGANDGIVEWWLNGVQQSGLSGLDTDTLDVDYVRLGPQGSLPSGTQGTLYFDSFISRRSFYQGLGNEISSGPSYFSYDGDGSRVKATVNGVTTVYIGNWYEKIGTVVKKYYYAGSTQVAMNDNGVVKYLFGDHLGSTGVIADASGGKLSENLYKPWGEDRYTWGTAATTFGFTGQRAERSVAGGLYYFNARWYDPYLSRWVQADSIVPNPGNSADLDRYAYVRNNPGRYNDPTGHCPDDDGDGKCEPPSAGIFRDNEHLTTGGRKAYEYYQWARDNAGWWNNNEAGTLTAEQYLGIFILYEAAGDRNTILNWIKDVVGYQLYLQTPKNFGGNSPYCTGDLCERGILNFMASYQGYSLFGDTSLLVERFSTLSIPPNFANAESVGVLSDVALKIGNENRANRSMYERGDPYTVPFHWGNPDELSRAFIVTTVTGIKLYQYP